MTNLYGKMKIIPMRGVRGQLLNSNGLTNMTNAFLTLAFEFKTYSRKALKARNYALNVYKSALVDLEEYEKIKARTGHKI